MILSRILLAYAHHSSLWHIFISCEEGNTLILIFKQNYTLLRSMKLPSERVQFILKFVFPSSHDWRVVDKSLNYYYRPRLWKFFELFYLTCLSDWICFFLYIYNDLNGPIGLAVTAYFFSIFGHSNTSCFS